MDLPAIAVFLALVAVGSYIQTVSGFAIALVIMGGVTILELATIAFAANVVSIVALVNTAVALFRNHHRINRRIATLACVGLVPMSAMGLFLLRYMSQHASDILVILLGIVIMGSGILLFMRPHPRRTESPNLAHIIAGGAGGVLSGLFGAGGPPVVIHLYRQPFDFATIRSTLLAILGVMTIARISYESVNGNIDQSVVELSLLSIPTTILATMAGRRYPPPITDLSMRRAAFVLLGSLGLALILMKV